MISIIKNANSFLVKTAIIAGNKTYGYSSLLGGARSFATHLLNRQSDLQEARVAFMVNLGNDYVKSQWTIWHTSGVEVSLCLTHPFPSIQYVLEDTKTSIVVVSPEYKSILEEYCTNQNIRLIETTVEFPVADIALPDIAVSRRAMILYTIGTTNKPKGVVTTHANLDAQPVTVMEKWKRISGQTLLERYGMIEIGMAISNPYHGERKAGYVGLPLPGVQIKLVDEQYTAVKTGEPDEIIVKGENVFNEY